MYARTNKISFELEKKFHHLLLSGRCCTVERRLCFGIALISISFELEKKFHRLRCMHEQIKFLLETDLI